MSTQLQHRRYTTAQLASITPAAGELMVDTTKKTVVVGDGSTVGGTPVSGDFTFNANVITLTDFTDGVLNVSGNVGSTTSVSISGTGWSLTYFESNSDPANHWSLTLTKTSGSSAEPTDDVATFLKAALGSFTFGSYTKTLTSHFVYSSSQMTGTYYHTYTYDNGYQIPGSQVYSSSSTTLSYGSSTQTDFTYTFSQTGEFIADSALIGNVLVTDDVITPVAYDAYGNLTTGTLTINGHFDAENTPFTNVYRDLNVETDLYVEANKKYLLNTPETGAGENIWVNLPTNPNIGDYIEIACVLHGNILRVEGQGINVSIDGSNYSISNPQLNYDQYYKIVYVGHHSGKPHWIAYTSRTN